MPDAPFFVAGGTVPPGAPSYVERAADRELLDALLAGEFSYVLNSRQMGKSSLAVRTLSKLEASGVRTAFVDLTRLGSTGADPERWYAGLLVETGRALGLRAEAMAYLKANVALPAVARLFAFLRDVALGAEAPLATVPSSPNPFLPDGKKGAPIVLMFDEIDAVRSLPFPADDLFAGLRELWNARATDPTLRRLTVCLLGAALPSDLIADPRRTPFNVGRRIELRDFTPEEARPFASGLLPQGGGSETAQALVDRVLHWTGGHPFLTQALCAELASPSPQRGEGGRGEREIDALVRARYLDARARETDTNLADVGNRLLGTGDPDVTDAARADVLSLYERMLRGKAVPDDESNPASARIKMSGGARVEGGLLRVRNRIYREAFGRGWIREAMPGAELRRQRRAFWRGALRAGAAAAVVVAAIGGLAWNSARLARAEKAARERADYEAYAASMSLMPSLWQAGGFERMDEILTAMQHNPDRGWEWGYWRRQTDPGGVWTDEMAGAFQPEVSPNGKLVAARIDDTIKIFDAKSLRLVDRISVPDRSPIVRWVDDDHLLTIAFTNTHLKLIDRRTKRVVRDYGRFFIGVSHPAPGHWTMAGWSEEDHKPYALDLRSGARRPLPAQDLTDTGLSPVAFSPEGRYCAIMARYANQGPRITGVVLFDTRGWSELKRIETPNRLSVVAFSPDGGRLAVGTDKDVTLWNWCTGKASPPHRELGGSTVDLRFSSDGHYLVATALQRRGVLYRVRPLDLQPTKASLKGVLYASFVPGGHLLLAGYDRNRLIDVDSLGRSDATPVGASGGIWRRDEDGLRLEGRRKVIDVDLSGAPMVRSHPVDSEYVDIGDAEGLVLDMKDPKRPTIQTREGGPRFALRGGGITGRIWSFPARDRCLVEWGAGKLRTVDLRTGRLGQTIDLSGDIDTLDVSRDGARFTVGFVDGSVGLVDVASGRTLWVGSFHHAWPVSQIRFSPDERTILTAGQDQTAAVIDAASGRLWFRLKGHLQALHTIDESPDGHRIATGSEDRTVRIWDAATGRELTSIPFESAVTSVRFSRDGRRLFVLLDSGALRVLSTD